VVISLKNVSIVKCADDDVLAIAGNSVAV